MERQGFEPCIFYCFSDFLIFFENLNLSHLLNIYPAFLVNILPYVPQDSDIRIYKELTEKGEFYEYLMEKFGANEERSAFKVRFFSEVFYSEENDNEGRTRFNELFPRVAEIIAYYKKVNHRDLAIELQKIEAEIMVNSVVKRLMDNKIFVLTIHDSILTTSENLELVKKIIWEEFNRYSLHPTLKVKC